LVIQVDATNKPDTCKNYATKQYMAEPIIRFTANLSHHKRRPAPYELGISEEDGLAGPRGIAVDDKVNIYVLDTENGRIQKYNSDGKFVSSIVIDKGRLASASDFCIHKDGKIYILYGNNNEVRGYTQRGKLFFKARYRDPPQEWWQSRPNFIPFKIYVDKYENLYLGSARAVCPLVQSRKRVNLLELGEVIDGAPGSGGANDIIYSYKKTDDNRTVHITRKTINGEEKAPISIVSKDVITHVECLGRDSLGNLYLLFNKYKGEYKKYWREIQKIDGNGNLIALIDNLPRWVGLSSQRDLAIDNKGNIYHLIFSRQGGILIKWHKK